MSGMFISAAHKSSGKTTLTIGLCAALTSRGIVVQSFKKGPDYIDPMWLAQASGRACYNLDPYLMGWGEIQTLFDRHAEHADFSIVEGNKGLFDGLALDGSNSNAAVAAHLGLPVVLVIDARGMTRGIAPLILGYQAFDSGIRIAGVILNNLGGARHEAKLRAVVEHYTDVPVLGAVHQDGRLAIVERELGLIPSSEAGNALAQARRIGEIIADQVDLDRLVERGGGIGCRRVPLGGAASALTGGVVRIGVVADQSFGFYYADDLEALRRAGADLVAIDALHDRKLPSLDGLFIGGGFPEMFARELSSNEGLRKDIHEAALGGLPIHAECGGLMYLSRSITIAGETHSMVGVVPGNVVMHKRPVGRGYVHLRETGASPWAASVDQGAVLRAHEFHYSEIVDLPPDVPFAYEVRRGHGVDGSHDGIVIRNTVASYSHLRSVGNCNWARNFVRFVASMKQRADLRVAASGGLPLGGELQLNWREGTGSVRCLT
ncbi:MAG TPA: cobyrinate a,c-diamide synthase [Rhodocyclaceae bacterium]|nr:cobyrinate a,c-diamide synthase [Rhodocyclaceae bacterium]HNB78206.1 cobyrinate a,c-diamide synthase [Rhodocyclaceae bacterium]HNC60302.1 cobyrinate a,c-diamide synthase [Rhodocyclaceae bacterium]HNH12002.1 cobyrinate a,c-diamide synthase [Rhodocyclaceae bacterium]HNH98087.1 cobyrinate a,c-diamide synthase [Rhodocyclaceae bacterium]